MDAADTSARTCSHEVLLAIGRGLPRIAEAHCSAIRKRTKRGGQRARRCAVLFVAFTGLRCGELIEERVSPVRGRRAGVARASTWCFAWKAGAALWRLG